MSSVQNENVLRPTPLTNSGIEEIADRLLIDKGLEDYFDRTIYATSVVFQLALVTEDSQVVTLLVLNLGESAVSRKLELISFIKILYIFFNVGCVCDRGS